MKAANGRLLLLVALGASLLTPPTYGATLAPCEVLPAASWSAIMGYTAQAIPGDMNCTYQGPGKSGAGQFRILAVVGSAAEAEASAKRMRDHQDSQPKSGHDAKLSAVASQGNVVFSIALFQPQASEGTAAQLEKLVAAAKEHLPK